MTPKQLNEAFREHDRHRTEDAQHRLSLEVERLAMMEPSDASAGLLDALDETLKAAGMSRADFVAKLVPFAKAADLRRRIEAEDEAAIVERRTALEADVERLLAARGSHIWRSVEWSEKNRELIHAESRLNETGFALTQLKNWRKELAVLENALPKTAPVCELAATL